MFSSVLRFAATALVLLPMIATAEPIKLKLSFFSSDRSLAYLAAIEPFVTAVNTEGAGLLEIEVYFSGVLAKKEKEQPQLVLDGKADIAFIVPGRNPELFFENTVIELPGLFRNAREATLVYTRLVNANLLAGYKDFFVIETVATTPKPIHSRKPIASLADLKGQKIRVNNSTEAVAFEKWGAIPFVLAFNETAPAISRGMIDGAANTVAELFDIGVGRLVSNHYLLATSSSPLTLMMNRQVFERLPEAAKTIIRKYSGEWAAMRYVEMLEKSDRKNLDEMKSDSRRHVVVPSRSDQEAAQRTFKSIADDWAAMSGHNRALLTSAEAELAKIRSEQ